MRVDNRIVQANSCSSTRRAAMQKAGAPGLSAAGCNSEQERLPDHDVQNHENHGHSCIEPMGLGGRMTAPEATNTLRHRRTKI